MFCLFEKEPGNYQSKKAGGVLAKSVLHSEAWVSMNVAKSADSVLDRYESGRHTHALRRIRYQLPPTICRVSVCLWRIWACPNMSTFTQTLTSGTAELILRAPEGMPMLHQRNWGKQNFRFMKESEYAR